MNRKWTVLLAACLLLLTACTSMEENNMIPSLPELNVPPAVEYETPDYQFEPSFFVEKHFFSNDEKELELAYYNYELQALSVANLEALSPGDAEAAERNVMAFNARMSTLLDEFAERGRAIGSDAVTLYAQESVSFDAGGFYDEASSTCYLAGDVVSVRLESSSYTGGAHGSYYTAGYLFDLRTGQFMDATQLSEDPEAFRAAVAELLIEKADAIEEKRDDYWPEYQETISRWNEGAVLFDGEGMLVLYSPYDLGSYALGPVELRLSYEELSDILSPAGMEHLGIAAEE